MNLVEVCIKNITQRYVVIELVLCVWYCRSWVCFTFTRQQEKFTNNLKKFLVVTLAALMYQLLITRTLLSKL